MNLPKYFIVIPRLDLFGPVKGAVALANELCLTRKVYIIVLKDSRNLKELNISNKINVIIFKKNFNPFLKLSFLKKKIEEKSNNLKPIIISFCFSADFYISLLNFSCIKVSSIRGNLSQNYKYTYGYLGIIFAKFHYNLFKKFDMCFVMNKPMRKKLLNYCLDKKIKIVKNFIDESSINKILPNKNIKKKKNEFKMIFIGNLNNRKNPFELLICFKKLINHGYNNIKLEICGEGNLKGKIYEFINKNNLHSFINIKGFIKNPYKNLISSDLFVLPSYSEGCSRASLESLYLGVPCVLKNVDGNKELINNKQRGYTYNNHIDLFKVLKKIINNRDFKNSKKKSLLDKTYSQKFCVSSIIRYLESIK